MKNDQAVLQLLLSLEKKKLFYPNHTKFKVFFFVHEMQSF